MAIALAFGLPSLRYPLGDFKTKREVVQDVHQ